MFLSPSLSRLCHRRRCFRARPPRRLDCAGPRLHLLKSGTMDPFSRRSGRCITLFARARLPSAPISQPPSTPVPDLVPDRPHQRRSPRGTPASARLDALSREAHDARRRRRLDAARRAASCTPSRRRKDEGHTWAGPSKDQALGRDVGMVRSRLYVDKQRKRRGRWAGVR